MSWLNKTPGDIEAGNPIPTILKSSSSVPRLSSPSALPLCCPSASASGATAPKNAPPVT